MAAGMEGRREGIELLASLCSLIGTRTESQILCSRLLGLQACSNNTLDYKIHIPVPTLYSPEGTRVL